jgi:hypothetical protein
MASGLHEFLIEEKIEEQAGNMIISMFFDGENYKLYFKENKPTVLIYQNQAEAVISNEVLIHNSKYVLKKTGLDKFSYKVNNSTVLDGEILFHQINNKIYAGPDLYFRKYQGVNQKPLKILALYYSAREVDIRVNGNNSFLWNFAL